MLIDYRIEIQSHGAAERAPAPDQLANFGGG
jgi:hypothetical protein